VKEAEEEEFRAFIAVRLDPLRRTAYLLCRDWHLADDLVSITVGKLYRHWRRVCAAGNVEAYVRGVLTHAWLDETRRPWRREQPTGDGFDVAGALAAVARPDELERRLTVLDLLAALPPRRRAVVVLRFYCDLSVTETAQLLGLAEGTVKSQASKGLETLRLMMSEDVKLETS